MSSHMEDVDTTNFVAAINRVPGLTDRERDVIVSRYGLTGRSMRIWELAKLHGVCEERMRQIIQRAVRHSRPYLFGEIEQ
jgi:DNA-directed RNA polymerase sigma subunit (sigma70/sigma32)